MMDGALRVVDVGVEGVYAAIADGMKAGQYAHENAALKEYIAALEGRNAELEQTVRNLTGELRKERLVNRRYRKERMTAWKEIQLMQSGETKEGRALRYLLVFSCGMFVIMALTMAIIAVL